jgi:hypothetical protein
MAEAKRDQKVTQPNLHDISIGKEWLGAKKDKKKIMLNLN